MRSTFLYSSALPSIGGKEPPIALRIAQTWLALGCFALLCLPELRGRSEWLGWLPLWLVIVPATQLVILRRRSLFAASRRAWNHLHRRRVKPMPRRARRLYKPAAPGRVQARTGALLAAFLFR
jgi:hypothetical protein